MKKFQVTRVVMMSLCFAIFAIPAHAQTAIQLFSPVNVRLSTTGSSTSNPATFNSNLLNLTCPASPTAVVSSTPDGHGNILVDNFINFTVTSNEDATGTDICPAGITDGGGNNVCFNSTYESEASSGSLNGDNPDTITATGGVSPIDISNQISSGNIQLQFDLIDTGGWLTSSSLYVVTNCTQQGVTGSGTVSGNPISQSNPTPAQLTQTFLFDPTTNQQITQIYDLSTAQNTPGSNLQINNGAIPIVTDNPLDPTIWQSQYATGTSFATSQCLLHTGELLNGQPACVPFTITCQVGTGSTATGAQCPVSQIRNELFEDNFDGPPFTPSGATGFPDIVIPNGPAFHQGLAYLMASEGWGGGFCQFDPASSIAASMCPQNILTSFSGPGGFGAHGTAPSPNSTLIVVGPVPEDLTTVTVAGQHPGGWINSQSATVNFSSQPPIVPPPNNGFIASPILSITYGTSNAPNVPDTTLPIPTDTVLTNSVPCPAPSSPTTPAAATFAPPGQSVTFGPDGSYLLHYFAEDCAGTEELRYSEDNSGNWSTTFYTVPVNVDTVKPLIVSGPILSPPPSTNNGVPNSYQVNQVVTATYLCTDERSGVVSCGTGAFPPGTLSTGNVNTAVTTATVGTKTFTVNATDAAGNSASPASVSYTVVSQPADLGLINIASPTIKSGTKLTYGVAAVNLGPNTASGVVVTDAVPAGTTFVSAAFDKVSCTLTGCAIPAKGTPCTFSGGTVTCNIGVLAPFTLKNLTGVGIALVVRVNAPKGTTIKDTATITGFDPDPKSGDNSSTVTTKVN